MNKRGKAAAVSAVLVTSLMGAALARAEAIPKKWKSLDVPGLTAKAIELQRRPAFTEGDIDLLAQYVAKRYASASASGKLDIKKWLTLASILSKRLPAKTCQAMAKEIQTKLAPNQDAIVKLSYQDCTSIAGALSRLGSKQGSVVLATWGEKTTALQSGKPGDLLSLARALVKIGDAGKKARARLASHIETKYLADAALAKLGTADCRQVTDALRTLGAKQAANVLPLRVEKNDTWQSWQPSSLGYLARELSRLGDAGKKARARLASHIEAKYVTEAALAKLGAADCGHVVGALRALGSKQASRVLPLWVQKNETWQSFKLGGLAGLADSLSKAGDIGKNARARLASHIEAKYVTEAALAKLGYGDCWRVINALRQLGSKQAVAVLPLWVEKNDAWQSWNLKGLSGLANGLSKLGGAGKNARARLASHIEAKYVTEAALAKLSFGDCKNVASIARAAGSKHAPAVLPMWVENSDAWQSFKPGDLLGLAGGLPKVGDIGKKARARLASHIGAKYLADAKSIRSVSVAHWDAIVSSVAKDLSKEARVAWAEKLYSAFTGDAAFLTKLSTRYRGTITGLLSRLGSKKAVAVLPLWVEKNDAWQSFKLGDLVGLARDLSRAGDIGKNARARLASHIEAKYVTETALAKLSFGDCKNVASIALVAGSKHAPAVLPMWVENSDAWQSFKLVGLVGLARDLSRAGDIGKNARARMASHLEAKYLADAGALAKLSIDDCKGVSGLLGRLASKQAAAVLPLWVEKSAVWQSWKLTDLGNLAKDLSKLGDAGKKARAKMASYLEAKYLADPAVLAKLSLNDSSALSGLLGRLASKQAVAVLPVLVDKTDAWQSWKLGDLRGLASDLSRAGDIGKKARARLASHIGVKYLADAKTIRSASIADWNTIVGSLAKDLSEEARVAWAKKFYSAFTGDAAFLTKLGTRDCVTIAYLLSQLGSKQSLVIHAVWVEKSDAWRSWKLADLAKLSGNLSKLGDVSKGARARVASHLEAKYLTDAEALGKLSVGDCNTLSRLLGWLGSKQGPAVHAAWMEKSDAWQSLKLADLARLSGNLSKLGDAGKNARARVANHLEAKYLTDARALAKLSVGDCNALSGLLGRLGSKQGPAVHAAWMEKSDAWQSLKLADLAKLSSALSKLGDAGKNARARLVGHIEAKYLTDAKTIRSASIADWNAIVGSLAKGLLEEARAAWGEKLYSALVADVAQPATAKALGNMLGKLDYKKGRSIPVTIVEKTDAWQSWKPSGLVDLGIRLPLGDEGKAARARLANHIEAKYLKDNAAVISATCGQWWDFAKCFAKTLSPESRKRWIAKLRAAYVDDAKRFAKLSSGEVLALSKALGLLGDANSSRIVTDWLSAKR